MNDPQPPPTANDKPAVWDLVINDVQEFFMGAVADCMVGDMRERDGIGKAKYGVRLQPFNGRKSLVDAYQESLDCTVYARQHHLENPDNMNAYSLYKQSLLLSMFIKSQLLAEEGK